MKSHEGCRRGFHWTSKAWYAEANRFPKEITFGMYAADDDGTTSGEMKMQWVELGKRLTPQLCVFDDAWSALATFSDLIQRMAEVDSEDISEEQFVNMLLACGFKDLTKYQHPYRV